MSQNVPVIPPVRSPTTRLALYVRLAFGALITFGVVGSVTGHHTGSMMVFIVTSLCWAVGRIFTEALEAYRVLTNGTPPAKPPDDQPPTIASV